MAVMGEGTVEYSTLISLTRELRVAIRSELISLTGALLASRLISPDNDIELRNTTHSEVERSARLVELVQNKVQQNPHHYHSFIGILQGNQDQYRDILQRLELTYKELKQEDGPQAVDINTVQSNIHNLECRFRFLHERILSELEEKDISVSKLLSLLTVIPAGIRQEYSMSIREAFPNIRRETTIREAFYHLSPLLDFLSCGLLKYIVDEHGSNSLKIMMKIYDDDVVEFMKKTTVKELMDNLSGQSDEVPPNFSKMRAKINGDPAAYTLHHLDQLRKRYCCELKLTDVVLVLIGLEMANSFIVEWIIPSALVSQLISSARKLDVEFYLNERIAQITVDEEQMFPLLPEREEVEITASKLDGMLILTESVENISSGIIGVSASSTPPTTKRVVDAKRLSPVPDIYGIPVASPSSRAKNELQELLQKSVFNYPPPMYDHLPPRGPSHKQEFTCKCVVKDNHDQVIHETQGSGSTKKKAEMNAAKEMMPFIRAMLEGGGELIPGALVSSTPPTTRRVIDTGRLSPVPDIYGIPVASPSSRAKNELQELLQKSVFNYPPPVYDHLPPRGPSHKQEFTCKCVVKDNRDQVIHETQGSGYTKKKAEMNAAKEMIPFISTMLEGGEELIPQGRPRIYRRTPPRELLDPTLDSDLFDALSMYTPHFELCRSIDERWLCLAIAESGCREGEPAVASHGIRDSESAAKREAGLNLIHSLRALSYPFR